MAAPRQLLLIDVPSLRVSDVRDFGPHLPHLHGLAQHCAAAIVPVAAGSTPARQVTLGTGLMPSQHRVIHGGLGVPMLGQSFWQRAKPKVPGLKTAFFGNCPQLALSADVHLRSENKKLVCHPKHLDPYFQQGLGDLDLGENLEQVFAHFTGRALAGGYGFIWVENARLAISRITQSAFRDKDKPVRAAAGLARLDAFVGTLLNLAGDRPVVLISSVSHPPCEHGFEQPDDLESETLEDGRILHVHCTPQRAPEVAARLRAHSAYARVLHGAARAELGLDCPEAGTVLAELKPGWGFVNQYIRDPSAPAGPDSDPADMPVFLARGITLPKSTIGICEVAWVLEHVLTGQEYHDKA